MTIKVTILDGCECGMTSALAGMFEQVISGSLHNYFHVSDRTDYRDVKKTLSEKSLEIRHLLENSPTGVFMMDSSKTCSIQTYTLRVSIPQELSVNIDFTCIPCSVLNFADCHNEELKGTIIGSDVIIIAIDTPYLMECDECIANAVNRIPEITNLLSNLNCETANSSMMVVFMPVKCEKWLKENRINEVNDSVKHFYSQLMGALLICDSFSLCIIPVQTMGNIEFVEMKEAYMIRNGDNYSERCAKLSDKAIRLQNGNIRKIMEIEEVVKDVSTSVGPDSVLMPNAWYMVSREPLLSSERSIYKPHNCDQLLLHILEFWARKIIFLNGNLPRYILYCFPPYFLKYKEMAELLLHTLMKSGLVKYNVDGIECLKQSKRM